jgi:hypothetical protein
MVNGVQQQLAPEQVANGPEFAVRVSDLSIHVARPEASHSLNGVLMHHTKGTRERIDRPGAFDVRRLDIECELAALDAQGYISIHFRKVPRELS